jgi:hypothetical protein
MRRRVTIPVVNDRALQGTCNLRGFHEVATIAQSKHLLAPRELVYEMSVIPYCGRNFSSRTYPQACRRQAAQSGYLLRFRLYHEVNQVLAEMGMSAEDSGGEPSVAIRLERQAKCDIRSTIR